MRCDMASSHTLLPQRPYSVEWMVNTTLRRRVFFTSRLVPVEGVGFGGGWR